MKKIIAILSVVLFTFGVAKAGELTVTGSAKASYAVTSSDGTAASNDSAKGLGIENEFTLGASGELDNGFVVTLTHGMSGEETAKSDTSSLSLDMGDMGTLSYNDADGHPGLAGLEDFMPKAYEQANDGLGGTTAVPATMAKMASGQGFGYSTTVGGAAIGIGFSDNLGATTDRTDGETDSVANKTSSTSFSVSYDVMDSLTVKGGVGSEGQGDGKELDHTTLGFVYSFGPAQIGYQINDEDDSAAAGTDYETEIYAVSFMINDNLSLSYGEHITEKSGDPDDQEADSIQASYSMGGVSINLKDSEMKNVGHGVKTQETTEILLSFAF